VVLDLGSVLATGLPDEIQRSQAVRDAYLGEGNVGSAEASGVDPSDTAPVRAPELEDPPTNPPAAN